VRFRAPLQPLCCPVTFLPTVDTAGLMHLLFFVWADTDIVDTTNAKTIDFKIFSLFVFC
jgi:hypothetical protein